jgi:glycosyltransferase 2 family protein
VTPGRSGTAPPAGCTVPRRSKPRVGDLPTAGVPVAAALTAVLSFRTATFWLPAPVAWVAFVALQRRARI